MRWGILSDPGSADGDVLARVLTEVLGEDIDRRVVPSWERGEIDVVVVAEFRTAWLDAAVVAMLREHAADGERPMLGVGAGAVMLSRAGLVAPGIEFVAGGLLRCRWLRARVETMATPFTAMASPGEEMTLPVRGRGIEFVGDDRGLERDGRIVLREVGVGSERPSNILAIRDASGNVVAMIPQAHLAAEPAAQGGGRETPAGARLLRSVAAWRDDAPRRRPAESAR